MQALQARKLLLFFLVTLRLKVTEQNRNSSRSTVTIFLCRPMCLLR
nr:MAG TPA: hypothetical protein [Caudoviricetes sp.]